MFFSRCSAFHVILGLPISMTIIPRLLPEGLSGVNRQMAKKKGTVNRQKRKIFTVNHQARVVWKVDNAIHRINHYPVDSVVCFVYTYPLDNDLSVGLRYPAFEQLGPDDQGNITLGVKFKEAIFPKKKYTYVGSRRSIRPTVIKVL